MTNCQQRLQTYQTSVEQALDHWLPAASTEPVVLHEAMRYSVLGDGKRIRPVLLYATGEGFGIDLGNMAGPACAVEMIHAYSLIHDDLPAMDNDDLRRGRPTCHKAYDDATAILAGDALQALAFQILAEDSQIKVNDKQRIAMLTKLARASGSRGMAGGQAIDLAGVGKALDINALETMHSYKTGALILASTQLGALCAEAIEDEWFERISNYGRCMGLAFQIRDDILDIESDTKTLGKPQGSDRELNKPTYPNLLGLQGAKDAASRLYDEAISNLDSFGEAADMLRFIADYIVNRNK